MPIKKKFNSLTKEGRYRRTDKGKFNNLSARARRKGLKMTLTFQEFQALLKKPCFYGCGGKASPTGYYLDRKNNSKGYTPGNVVPCCYECNGIRSNKLTVEETKIVIKALTEFRNLNK